MNWISINDKLPETTRGVHAKLYFVASIDPGYISVFGVARYAKKYIKSNSKGWYDKSDDIFGLKITHWMLPKI